MLHCYCYAKRTVTILHCLILALLTYLYYYDLSGKAERRLTKKFSLSVNISLPLPPILSLTKEKGTLPYVILS